MAGDPRVQHLLRRVGFGADLAEVSFYSERGYPAALDALIDFHRMPDPDGLIGQPGYATVTPAAGANEPFSPGTIINDARQRWLFRMAHWVQTGGYDTHASQSGTYTNRMTTLNDGLFAF